MIPTAHFPTPIYVLCTNSILIKGNNKITELLTILQRESQNSYEYRQKKSVNNWRTVKTVMTLTSYRVESDFKAPNLPLSLRLKVSGCHYNSIYNNT